MERQPSRDKIASVIQSARPAFPTPPFRWFQREVIAWESERSTQIPIAVSAQLSQRIPADRLPADRMTGYSSLFRSRG